MLRAIKGGQTMRLKEKVAIVTGAASGMGREMVLMFAKEGAKVVAADYNEAGAKTVVDEIVQDGGTATAVVANVAVRTDVENMIDIAVDTYGTLDILVNNAGIMDRKIGRASCRERVEIRVWRRG